MINQPSQPADTPADPSQPSKTPADTPADPSQPSKTPADTPADPSQSAKTPADTPADSSHRELVTSLRKLGLPSVLSARDRGQDLLRRVAVPLWMCAGIMLSIALFHRTLDVLSRYPITDDGYEVILPEQAFAPLGGTVMALIAVPLLGVIAAVLASRRRSSVFASVVGLCGVVMTVVMPVFPSPDKPAALGWGLAVAVAIVGLTYLGVGAVLSWSVRRVGQEIFTLGPMVARTLPLFTLASLFLFYNAEIWQVMLPLTWPRILQVAAILGVLTLFLVAVTTRDEVHDLLDAHSGNLRRSERLNIVLIPSLVTVIQSLLFAALVFLFFLAFGQLSVSDATIFAWTQSQVDKTLWENYRIPFAPTLIKVSFILAALAALNFAASAASDANHRQRFVSPLIAEVALGLDTRAAYLKSQRTTPVH